VFAIARRRGIRPITIGRQLVATMDELALSNNGNVPSTYKVLVSPSNLELLSPTLKPIAHELRQAVTHHATYEGYSLAGEAVISFEHDENLGSSECVIRPSKVSSVRATTTDPVVAEPVERQVHALVLDDGVQVRGRDGLPSRGQSTPESVPSEPRRRQPALDRSTAQCVGLVRAACSRTRVCVRMPLRHDVREGERGRAASVCMHPTGGSVV
jgi:hypothetical protein